MNKEFFDALDVIEKERNIKKEFCLKKSQRQWKLPFQKTLVSREM